MPPARIELYAAGGAALLGQVRFLYLGAAVGIPAGLLSDTISCELWNAKGDGTADAATGISLIVFESPATLQEWNQRGRATLERWTECRLVGVIGDAEPQTTPWTPVGTGRPFLVNPIPANSARVLEMRSAPPGGVATYDADFLVSADWQRPAIALGLGWEEAGIRGVRSGIGDTLHSCLLEGGDVGQDEAGPSDQLILSDTSWIHKGEPHQDLKRTIAVTAVAADGALAGGEAYWLALTRGASDTVPTQTKGNKGLAPRPTSARPEPPAGEPFLGWVHVTDALAIAQADIYQEDRAFGRLLFYQPVGGLNAKIGKGEAIGDNFHVRYETPRDVALPAAEATLSLWLLPNVGQLATSIDGSPPADRALLLWEGATDADGVTASRDMRRILAGQVEAIRFRFNGEPAVNDAAYAATGAATSYLRVPEPIEIAIDAHGTATGGRTAFLIERWDGAAWASLFPSSGTEDRLPAVEFDAAELSNLEARPEVLKLGPYTRLRCRCVEIASGGTGPSGVEVVLFTETP